MHFSILESEAHLERYSDLVCSFACCSHDSTHSGDLQKITTDLLSMWKELGFISCLYIFTAFIPVFQNRNVCFWMKCRGHSCNVFSVCGSGFYTRLLCWNFSHAGSCFLAWPDSEYVVAHLSNHLYLLKTLPTLKASLFLSHTHRDKGTKAVTLSHKAEPFQTVLLCTLEIIIFTALLL